MGSLVALWQMLSFGGAIAQSTGPADALLSDTDLGPTTLLRRTSSLIELQGPLVIYSNTFTGGGDLVASYIALPYEGLATLGQDEVLNLVGTSAGGVDAAAEEHPRVGDDSRWFTSFSPDTGPGHTVAFRVGQSFGAVEVRGGPSGTARVRRAAQLGAIAEARLGSSQWTVLQPTTTVFARTWARHGLSVHIREDGSGTASWRVYRWCSAGPAPCDSIDAQGTITAGGSATLTFSGVNDRALRGRVLSTTDTATFNLGEIRMHLVPYDMVVVQDENAQPLLLCGERTFDLLPMTFREFGPCGA